MSLRHLKLATLLLVALLAFAGCDDDDSGEKPEETAKQNAVAQSAVVQLSPELGKLTKEQTFRRLGATPVSSHPSVAKRDPKHPNRKRLRFTCYRFKIKGGKPTDFAELCFRNDRQTLETVFTSTAAAGGSVPPAALP